MVDLKTLKDIEPKIIGNQSALEKSRFLEGVGSCKYFSRQEAIKWIKEIDYKVDKCGEEPSINVAGLELSYDYDEIDTRGAILMLKHFFNLSDEDLR